tara:strand:+ start:396 stop:629 length:234 start_codon:yes stop_codon:yes gene_type:complete
MDYTLETLRPNTKTILVDEIIRLRVLNNTKVDFNKLDGCSDVKMWLFTKSWTELFDMQVDLIAKLKAKGGVLKIGGE